MTTIVLADDHPVVLQGLRTLLEAEPELRVVGETGDGLEAVRLTERLQPDVLVLDLILPGLGGMEVARQVTARVPKTRVLVLSMLHNEAYVLEALRNGAAGYVLKAACARELVDAVRAVAGGRRYLSSSLSERAIEAYIQKAQAAPQDPYETLTTREREVLHLAAEGCTSAEIADRLCIGRRTVETHRANLKSKLGLESQADLIRYVLQRGIAPPER